MYVAMYVCVWVGTVCMCVNTPQKRPLGQFANQLHHNICTEANANLEWVLTQGSPKLTGLGPNQGSPPIKKTVDPSNGGRLWTPVGRVYWANLQTNCTLIFLKILTITWNGFLRGKTPKWTGFGSSKAPHLFNDFERWMFVDNRWKRLLGQFANKLHPNIFTDANANMEWFFTWRITKGHRFWVEEGSALTVFKNGRLRTVDVCGQPLEVFTAWIHKLI